MAEKKQREEFRVHGIAAIVQDQSAIAHVHRRTDPGNPAWHGIEGRSTWFHFAIPTPRYVRGDRVNEIDYVRLVLQRDEGVEIPTIHVRQGYDLEVFLHNPAIAPNRPTTYVSRQLNKPIRLADGSGGAVVVSVLVRWEAPGRPGHSNGVIRFYEAGIAFTS